MSYPNNPYTTAGLDLKAADDAARNGYTVGQALYVDSLRKMNESQQALDRQATDRIYSEGLSRGGRGEADYDRAPREPVTREDLLRRLRRIVLVGTVLATICATCVAVALNYNPEVRAGVCFVLAQQLDLSAWPSRASIVEFYQGLQPGAKEFQDLPAAKMYRQLKSAGTDWNKMDAREKRMLAGAWLKYSEDQGAFLQANERRMDYYRVAFASYLRAQLLETPDPRIARDEASISFQAPRSPKAIAAFAATVDRAQSYDNARRGTDSLINLFLKWAWVATLQYPHPGRAA